MRFITFVLAAFALFTAAPAFAQTAPAEAKKINVTLLTGSDIGVHPWKECSAAVKEALEATGRFNITVSEDLKILEDAANIEVIAVVGSFRDKKWELDDAKKAALLKFVNDGKGLYLQHYATASWPNWAEFEKLCGKRWVNGKSGHGPKSVFEVKIKDAEHPIVKGLKDFKTDDELYAKLVGTDEEIKAVATADSDFSKKTEPIVFTRDYGKGRVVVNNLGHDKKALEPAEVKAIVVRSIEWAATGKVAEKK
jgi:type 1 glutamine amidotransferase